MNADIYAEWLRRQGYKIYRTESSYWFNAAPKVLQAFPFHWQITPCRDETEKLIRDNGIIALRYSSPVSKPHGKLSYHIVVKGCYDLHSVRHQARNGVKRGLERFSVEEISFERMHSEGWVLQEDTLARQKRSGSMSKVQWNSICQGAKELPGFHAIGAIKEGILAAAVIVCRIDDVYTVPYSMSHCRYLHDHVNNALFYSSSCQLLKHDNINELFFCVESLDAGPEVDEFKIRMGFEKREVKQHVEFHPFLKPLAGTFLHKTTDILHKSFPSVTSLSKMEGMLRFSLCDRYSRVSVPDVSYSLH